MKLGVNGRFLSAPPGGVQRFAREVLRRLASREDVTLLLPRGGAPPEGLPAQVRIARGVLPGHLWEQLELPILARRASVQVTLHLANAAPLWGGPHVVVLHDLGPLIEPAAFRASYRMWARIAHAGAAKRAAAVVTVSVWSADRIATLLGVPRDRVVVARQGAAPLDAPATPEAVAAVRRRYGLPDRYFVAATGGDARKGEAFLRDAWRGWPPGEAPALALVGARFGRVHVTGAPAGPPRAEHEAVRVLGYVPDEELRALLTGAVALLHPSRFEGFGRPPLEALACGTRVIAAPYGPVSEVVDGAAELVPADVDAWRDAVHRLLEEPAGDRACRIDRGRTLAADFTWDATVDTLVRVCHGVSEGGR